MRVGTKNPEPGNVSFCTVSVANGSEKAPAPSTFSWVQRSPALIVTLGCTVQVSWTNRSPSLERVGGIAGPSLARVTRKRLPLSKATAALAPTPLRTSTVAPPRVGMRSEEHTSELQSLAYLV